ncbi:MAG TPA: hypothetical protein VKX45_02040 [Bryobacteraceae bacterium]|jgi:hypothetical protein|nr:hypothetical protein [Bryobacteraceae bacterium]
MTKKITAAMLSIATLAILTAGALFATSKADCCNGQECCKTGSCCRSHHHVK